MIYPWQELTWQYFCKQRQTKRLPHAIIISGMNGLGKLALANEAAKIMLCQRDNGSQPCGDCHSCRLFRAESHPDHTIVKPEESSKQIQIEQIRQLKYNQALTPRVANWKTVIISPADSMNTHANNSLLKLLEEPQENTLLILVTARPDRLPITILSRCQRLKVATPDTDIATHWLQQQNVAEDAIASLLTLAKGAPIAALAMAGKDTLLDLNKVEQDFALLLQGHANPVTLAKRWQQHDLIMLLSYLQLSVKRSLLDQYAQDAENNKHYWYIYDCIVATIRLTLSPSNISKILLVEQFMVSVIQQDYQNTTALY